MWKRSHIKVDLCHTNSKLEYYVDSENLEAQLKQMATYNEIIN
jgi:hypothetical protein